MKLPLQVTFRDVPHSPAVEAVVQKRVAKLERIYDRMMGCRVVIEAPHKQHRRGNLFNCRIDLTIPGDEIVIGRESADNHAHEDIYVAVNDAFRVAERQLKQYASRRNSHRA